MDRPSLAVVVVAAVLLAGASLGAEASTPAPTAASSKPTKPPAAFSTKIHTPTGQSLRVSAADCNRRAVAAAPANGQLGPTGASTSQTLITVPVGGGSAAAATREQQISEACAHLRR